MGCLLAGMVQVGALSALSGGIQAVASRTKDGKPAKDEGELALERAMVPEPIPAEPTGDKTP